MTVVGFAPRKVAVVLGIYESLDHKVLAEHNSIALEFP
jgi:hypothetical protein